MQCRAFQKSILLAILPPLSCERTAVSASATANDFQDAFRLHIGWNCRFPKKSHGRCGQGPGSVDPRFPAGLPFQVPEILEFIAFCDSEQNFPAIFPGLSRSFPWEPEQTPETATAFSSFLTASYQGNASPSVEQPGIANFGWFFPGCKGIAFYIP